MDALSVLHDYCYKDPQHPAPGVGGHVHLEYDATQNLPCTTLDQGPDGTATLLCTLPHGQAELLAVRARDYLLRGISLDPADLSSVGKARQAQPDFDEQVDSAVRAWVLSAAQLLTGVVAMLPPAQGQEDDGEREADRRASQHGERAFLLRFTAMPRSELSSYDAVEVAPPEPAVVTGEQIDARMRWMAMGDRMRGASDNAGAAATGGSPMPQEGTPAWDDLRSRATESLRQEVSRNWREEFSSLCNTTLAKRLTQQPPEHYAALLADELLEDRAELQRTSGGVWPDPVPQDMRDQAESQAREMICASMAVDAMSRHLGIMVNRRTVLATAGIRSAADDADRAALEGMLFEGELPQVCLVAMRQKAGEAVARMAMGAYERAEEARRQEQRRDEADAAAGADEAGAAAAGSPAACNPAAGVDAAASDADGARG